MDTIGSVPKGGWTTWGEFKAWLEGYESKGFGDTPSDYELQDIKDRLNRVRNNQYYDKIQSSQGFSAASKGY